MNNNFTNTASIIDDAVRGLKDYIEVMEVSKLPKTKEEKWELFKYLIESPADWTGYYSPEDTFGEIDFGNLCDVDPLLIVSSVSFAKAHNYYREDMPMTTEIICAIRLYVGLENFDEILRRVQLEYDARLKANRMAEMLRRWNESHLKLAEDEERIGNKSQAKAERYVAETITQIVELLLDDVYA